MDVELQFEFTPKSNEESSHANIWGECVIENSKCPECLRNNREASVVLSGLRFKMITLATEWTIDCTLVCIPCVWAYVGLILEVGLLGHRVNIFVIFIDIVKFLSSLIATSQVWETCFFTASPTLIVKLWEGGNFFSLFRSPQIKMLPRLHTCWRL